MNEENTSQHDDRMTLLKQMLVLTEDIISILKSEKYDMGAVNDLLFKRQNVINELSSYDEQFPLDTPGLFTAEELNDMNTLVRLILGLSNDAARMIESEKNHLLSDMRVNCKEQKLAMYQTSKKIPEDAASSGKFLNLNR